MSSQSVVYEKDVKSEEWLSRSIKTKIHVIFQLARPAPKYSLRLAPKLLLQIQLLAQNHRPVPVLELWQPIFRKPKLTGDFYQKVKLRTGDIYATLDDSYITNLTGTPKDLSSAEQYGDSATLQKDIVAVMCQKDKTTSTIHFRDARCSWEASAGTGPAQSTPTYRFTISDENRDSLNPGRMVLQWEKRSKEDATAGSLGAEQFVLLLIDLKARRRSRIATMTPDMLEIVVRKSSILEYLQVCFDLTQPVFSRSVQGPCDALSIWLYTQTLTLGAWVAYQEGWFN
ncbi:uncharacterized protein N7529_005134 [Penicillium soppii]|uniref:uncharacterized protein n=1 Tax=Penicillium soppii TaxID=69789 RepID=UPI0025474855|nr:uncharacterized protein N7529_005134 [Penicillium soppii]KAJ5872781.1 hypothetical protein N7529_005134 [Penicillium soppii]